MGPKSLPFDVLYYLIKYLDIPTLQAFSACSSALRKPALPHLFATITVHPRNTERSIKILDEIRQEPHIYVHYRSFCVTEEQPWDPRTVGGPDDQRTLMRRISGFIHLLPNLSTVSFHFIDLQSPLFGSLQDLFRQDSIKGIHLVNCHFSNSHGTLSFPNRLEKFTFQYLDPIGLPVPDVFRQSNLPPTITTLDIYLDATTVRLIRALISEPLAQLQSFAYFDWQNLYADDISTFLQSHPTTTSISFAQCPLIQHEGRPPPLPNTALPKLSHIRGGMEAIEQLLRDGRPISELKFFDSIGRDFHWKLGRLRNNGDCFKITKLEISVLRSVFGPSTRSLRHCLPQLCDTFPNVEWLKIPMLPKVKLRTQSSATLD